MIIFTLLLCPHTKGERNMYAEHIKKTIKFALEKGLNILPVNEKTPAIKWKGLQKKKQTLSEINNWPSSFSGIALITGKINNIVVLDVDVKNGKNGFKYIGDKMTNIVTPCSKTPSGGIHYFFKYPQGENIGNVTDLYGENSGVDIRAEGGFVVIPHTEGYQWIIHFDSVPLAPLPEWLLEDIKNKSFKKRSKTEKQAPKTKTKEQAKIKNLKGKIIEKYFSDEDTVKKLLPLLGIPDVEIGPPFNCVLPCDKEDTRPSASLYKGENGVVVYRNWRASENEPKYYTLPEVYASLKYREKKTLNAPEMATWALRMLVEAGILQVKEIQAPELPPNLKKKKAVNAVYEGFKLLIACKKLYDERQDTTAFSYQFGKAWCGVSLRSVQTAMIQLETLGYIQRVGKEGNGTRTVNVYRLRDIGTT
jgi:hypothetical protein